MFTTLLGKLLCLIGLHNDDLDFDCFSTHAYRCSRCGTIHGHGRRWTDRAGNWTTLPPRTR